MHPESVVNGVRRVIPGALACALTLAACGAARYAARPQGPAPATVAVSSPAFRTGGTLPRRFSCDGAGSSPPLAIASVPASARSLALVLDDPDAPGGDFVHWVVFGIAPTTRSIAAGSLPAGARQARNGFGRAAYGGPCPPRGDRPHRYVLTVYALRSPIAAPDGAPAARVRAAAARDALASGQVLARYARPAR